MKRINRIVLLGTIVYSLFIPSIGYFYVGSLVAFLFLVGYIGGFAMWIMFPSKASWSEIRTPYWTAFAVYIFLHKVEENRMKFFEVLGEKITGIPVPELSPLLVIGLLILPIGAWLLIPILVKRGHPTGYYLVWTYFMSFGLVELAHFIFPLLTGEPYSYFPGMISAAILSPIGFWGMWKLAKGGVIEESTLLTAPARPKGRPIH